MSNNEFIAVLKTIVGGRYVLTGSSATRPYRHGIRFGRGDALAVVRPGSLVEMWRVLKACVEADKIVIAQAANTGLTGGSTPDGNAYDRDVVIVSTLRITGIHLVKKGEQVICLPGATLYQLEEALTPLGRNPHSVIGSSCVGASVLGGICNNSGGALIQRGPAFTQMTLFARVGEEGEVQLINHLGVRLSGDPEAVLACVEAGEFADTDIEDRTDRCCSDHGYQHDVRQIDAATPARFNADPKRLFESSGSAGKVMVFAVRLDTFPKEERMATFYIGTNDPAELTNLRRDMLSTFQHLPVQAEYLHRDAFDIAAKYGKDTVLSILYLGTDRLPLFFALKARFDGFFSRFNFLPQNLSDCVLQFTASLFPKHLPQKLYDYRDRYEHHLILKVADGCIDETRDYLAAHFPSQNGAFFECTKREGERASLLRFSAAGAANRYRAIHSRDVADIMALDIALPRNAHDWVEHLPQDIEAKLALKLYYGHFFCHVFHQDYVVRRGFDPIEVEHEMWRLLDQRGAEYPAEHNVGHLYVAKPALKDHYRALDPTNSFNPGLGQTSKRANWR